MDIILSCRTNGVTRHGQSQHRLSLSKVGENSWKNARISSARLSHHRLVLHFVINYRNNCYCNNKIQTHKSDHSLEKAAVLFDSAFHGLSTISVLIGCNLVYKSLHGDCNKYFQVNIFFGFVTLPSSFKTLNMLITKMHNS